MRLENFLALTQTTLINEPCVHSFENIVFDAIKVKRGDLFFAYDTKEIQLAVENGAYGIISEKPAKISDNEIAWIKADSLDDALHRLIRFKTIEKEMVAYECNEIVLKLSLQVITMTYFRTIIGDLKSIFKIISEAQQKTTLLFSPALTSRDMFAVVKKMPIASFEPIEIMEQTLFETSFIYDNVFYERQLISPFFIPYLEELLHFYRTLKIEYKLKKFTPIEHFEPVFTNKRFEIKNFGTSDKVLIFEPNVELIEEQISFLERHASWANTIFVVPHDVESKESKNIFRYKNEKEIINILRNTLFNFALIVGVDKSLLSRPLSNQTQLTIDF
ncbi:MAG: hypothetical protein WC274_09100 [Sulfurimonas sp.]|jgi:ferrochelatase